MVEWWNTLKKIDLSKYYEKNKKIIHDFAGECAEDCYNKDDIDIYDEEEAYESSYDFIHCPPGEVYCMEEGFCAAQCGKNVDRDYFSNPIWKDQKVKNNKVSIFSRSFFLFAINYQVWELGL